MDSETVLMDTKKLKVILVTMDEPFYIPAYIDNIFCKLPKTVEVIKVYALHPHLANRSFLHTVWGYFSYFGIIVFTYMVLLRLFYIICDFFNQYFNVSNRFHSVALVCNKYDIPCTQTYKINANDVLSELRDSAPDIIFSVSSPQIFKKNLISIPSKGCLNIHSSLLPLYRGQNANFWVMAKAEKETGVTIHYINSGIDDGDILLQEKIMIQNDWSLHDLYMKAIETGSTMIAESLQMVCQNKVTTRKNDISKGSFFAFPSKSDVKEFRSRKKRFFKYY
jgi:folate-dependent phosphoribosylglycinamide formyltransferase PurN